MQAKKNLAKSSVSTDVHMQSFRAMQCERIPAAETGALQYNTTCCSAPAPPPAGSSSTHTVCIRLAVPHSVMSSLQLPAACSPVVSSSDVLRCRNDDPSQS